MSADAAAACFAQRYAEARDKFMAAAGRASLAVTSQVHPLRGHDAEELALDVARDGPLEARAVLLVTSACHGVEGFCGSGIQVALLGDAGLREFARARGVAVVLAHALNPHGFSWWRRVTHEGVDLNRNFPDFSQPLPANAGYDALAAHIVPRTWPPAPEDEAALMAYAGRHGLRALQEAVSGGQYAHPEGVFFGGSAPTWSHLALRQLLRVHASRAARLGWIDLHTGLGPEGVGERIFAGRDDAASIARARAWWGPGVTSIYDGSSSSALLTGLMWNAAYEECAQAEFTGIALEYGTLPLEQMLHTLRWDHWAERHLSRDDERRAEVRREVRDAFYIDTPAWKARVLEQAQEAVRQAIEGLAA